MDVEEPAESLARRFAEQDDEEALGRIVKRFMPPALGAAREILSDPALAEDAVQETFLRMVRARRQYDPARPFSTWLYAILRNVCRDMLRRRVREARAMSDIGRARSSETARPPVRAEGPAASAVLATLPDKEREVLALRILHGLSFADVSAALGISEEAAKKRAQRGLRRLRGRVSLDDSVAGPEPAGFSCA